MDNNDKLKAMLRAHSAAQDAWENRDVTALARKSKLGLADWIRITGIAPESAGVWGRYRVAPEAIIFIGWTEEFIREHTPLDQADIRDKSEHRLAFPCTPRELVKFFDGDLYGDFGCLPDEFRAAVAAKIPISRVRSEEIRLKCIEEGFPLMEITTGGKSIVRRALLAESPRLFSASTFKEAWQVALDEGLVRMKDSEKYSARGK